MSRKLSPWHLGCRLILVVWLSVSGCSSSSRVAQDILPSVSGPSEDEETRISREFRREARKQLPFVTNPEIERYIDRIGQRILSAMGPQPFDYRFFVIQDSQLNAFAVPGGSIFFFSGLIERAKTTSEIAGVLGHEIIHIKGRHMARQSGFDAVSLLGLLGAFLLARTASGGQAAGAVGQAVAATRQIAYSRQLEMEADTLGVRYMAAAGFDPKGSLGFLKTLDQERALNPIDIPAYMMTHPITQERIANTELVIRSLGKTDAKADQPDLLKKIQIILRIERRDGEAVLAEYEKLVRQNPESSESLHLLGVAQHQTGQLASAKQNYEKARRLNPENPDLNRDLGRLYTQTGDFALARAAFNQALALEPKEPLTYLYLGELYEKEGDLPAAAGAYLNAANLSPFWEKPPYRLSVVYGKLDRLGDAYYYHGRSLLLQDDDQRALADFDKAIKIFGEKSPRGQLIKEELAALRARRR
ncbi:MAG TPA: M48 family metalloprotease [Candidatus Binatia bacterium]|nr:M48 family metalloprotease [Candidatus Binatia bacterium]